MAKSNGTRPFSPARLPQLVRDSASQAWHVGMDAYSRVGGLLSIGGRIDREAKSRVYEARNSASDAWHRLESSIRLRVAQTLNALQIPTARDVQELSARVAELHKAVAALERRAGEGARSGPAPRRGGTAARPARKTSARGRPKTGS
jgi:hypothetical protein